MNRPAADPRPQLAAHAVVLWRSATELQVGIDPSAVVDASCLRVLRALAAGEPYGRLVREARAAGLDQHGLTDLLDAFERARLLQPPNPAADAAVRMVGAGPLGARVAQELLAAGFGTVYLADLPDRAPRTRPSVEREGVRHPARPARLDQLGTALARETGGRVRVTRHFLKPEGAAVALTIVAADGPEPDRLVTDLLRDHGAPHLLVRSSGAEVAVGPLVVPGVTSCVRCGDLIRRDRDPAWPGLLDQLTRLTLTPSPTLLTWAAATATAQALAFVDRVRPESLGHSLELRSDDHSTCLRPWPVHPDCPCRWDGLDDALTDLATDVPDDLRVTFGAGATSTGA